MFRAPLLWGIWLGTVHCTMTEECERLIKKSPIVYIAGHITHTRKGIQIEVIVKLLIIMKIKRQYDNRGKSQNSEMGKTARTCSMCSFLDFLMKFQVNINVYIWRRCCVWGGVRISSLNNCLLHEIAWLRNMRRTFLSEQGDMIFCCTRAAQGNKKNSNCGYFQ